MTMDFDDLTFSYFETKVCDYNKFNILNDKNVKQVLSHLILKMSFLTLVVCGVNVTPDINPIYGSMDRPCPKDYKN